MSEVDDHPNHYVEVEINMADISDEDILEAYYGRFPPSTQEDIATLLDGSPVTPLPLDLLKKLIAWANKEKNRKREA